MPYNTKEKQREHDKKYRQEHKQEIKTYFQEHKQERKQRYEKRKEYLRRYYQDHKEEQKEKTKRRRIELRNYGRNHTLGIEGKRISGLFKRPFTGYCELCGRIFENQIRKLGYHHWDDKDVEKGKKVKGIWVCEKCHRACDVVERGDLYIIQRYLRLKRFINKEHNLEKKLKSELN